jgi:hypothetical protein
MDGIQNERRSLRVNLIRRVMHRNASDPQRILGILCLRAHANENDSGTFASDQSRLTSGPILDKVIGDAKNEERCD